MFPAIHTPKLTTLIFTKVTLNSSALELHTPFRTQCGVTPLVLAHLGLIVLISAGGTHDMHMLSAQKLGRVFGSRKVTLQ